jgi:hypothetical protein
MLYSVEGYQRLYYHGIQQEKHPKAKEKKELCTTKEEEKT